MSIMLVGNKTDLDADRVISTEEGQQLAEDHNLLFMETSAKTGYNVDVSFMEISKSILSNIEMDKYDLSTDSNGIKVGISLQKHQADVPGPPGCAC